MDQKIRDCDVISPMQCPRIVAELWCHPSMFRCNLYVFPLSWMPNLVLLTFHPLCFLSKVWWGLPFNCHISWFFDDVRSVQSLYFISATERQQKKSLWHRLLADWVTKEWGLWSLEKIWKVLKLWSTSWKLLRWQIETIFLKVGVKFENFLKKGTKHLRLFRIRFRIGSSLND